MSDRFPIRRLLGAALLLAAWPAQLQAEPALSDSSSSARIVSSLSVQKLADLDFGVVTVTTAGTVISIR